MSSDIRRITTTGQAWEELVFHQNALGLDPLTRDLAGTPEPLITRCGEVEHALREAVRVVLRSQAVFGDVNFRADAGVNDFAWDLEKVAGKQSAALFRRYFAVAPSRLVRRALGAMAARMKIWVPMLRTEPDASLSRHAATIDGLADEAQAAANGIASARGAKAEVEARVEDDYLDDVNAFRLDLRGELLKRAAANGKTSAWVDKFFRPAPPRKPAETDEPGEPTPPTE